MSTHLLGFQSFLSFLHHILLAKLAISSMRVKHFSAQKLCQKIATASCRDVQEATKSILHIFLNLPRSDMIGP